MMRSMIVFLASAATSSGEPRAKKKKLSQSTRARGGQPFQEGKKGDGRDNGNAAQNDESNCLMILRDEALNGQNSSG